MSDKKLSVCPIRVCSECGTEVHLGQLYHWHGPADGDTFPVEEIEVIPLDSPQVLSPKEARTVAAFLDIGEHGSPARLIADRLSDWAKEDGSDGAGANEGRALCDRSQGTASKTRPESPPTASASRISDTEGASKDSLSHTHSTGEVKSKVCPDCLGKKGWPPDEPCETCGATGWIPPAEERG